MQPVPFTHQIDGAQFLAAGGVLLADEPRVGKTGASVIGMDLLMARRALVVTTASGRANFGREVREWQAFPRRVQVVYGATDKLDPDADVLVVGWSVVADKRLTPRLEAWRAELAVLDESHYAKSFDAKRTVAAMDLGARADRTFCLSGTPMPNSPLDLWPSLVTFAPWRVSDLTFDQYIDRYCVVRRKFIADEWKPIILRGKNEAELRQRLDGFWLRRTQQDVGIREPIYATLALDAGNFASAENLLFPKSTDLSAIKAAVIEAAKAEWGDKAIDLSKNGVIKQPILDGDGPQGVSKKTGERHKELEGMFFIRCASNLQPVLPNKKVMATKEAEDLYSGCYGYAAIHAYTWESQEKGRGVSIGLSMVQHAKDGEKLGGGPADPSKFFEAIPDEDDAPAGNTGDGAGALFS